MITPPSGRPLCAQRGAGRRQTPPSAQWPAEGSAHGSCVEDSDPREIAGVVMVTAAEVLTDCAVSGGLASS